jgi:hypothetical protein
MTKAVAIATNTPTPIAITISETLPNMTYKPRANIRHRPIYPNSVALLLVVLHWWQQGDPNLDCVAEINNLVGYVVP